MRPHREESVAIVVCERCGTIAEVDAETLLLLAADEHTGCGGHPFVLLSMPTMIEVWSDFGGGLSHMHFVDKHFHPGIMGRGGCAAECQARWRPEMDPAANVRPSPVSVEPDPTA